jgi:hypothetical protein
VILRNRRLEAVHAVARGLVQAGYGKHAVIHGSAASSSGSFVLSDWGPLSVSDVDVLLIDDLPASHVAELQAGLSDVCVAAMGGMAGPNARVSVKTVSNGFVTACEAESLMHSATFGGRTAFAVHNSSRRLTPTHRDIHFPYALEYGYLRWLNFAPTRGPSQVAALYELAKGLLRVRLAVGRGRDEATISLISDRELIRTIELLLPLATRKLGSHATRIAAEWLRSRDLQLELSSQELLQGYGELELHVRHTMSRSLLVERVRNSRHSLGRC